MLNSRGWQLAIAAFWIVLALLAVPFALDANRQLDTSARLDGSEYARVEAALRSQFKSPFTNIALLRIVGLPDPAGAEGRQALQRVVDALKQNAVVQGVMSYLDRDDSLFIGEDGSAVLLVGMLSGKDQGAETMARLRSAGEVLRSELRDDFPELNFQWTGEAAVGADMRRLSAAETRAAELSVLPLTVLLLLWAFRSPLATLLPIVCGLLTIVISLGALTLLDRVWPASIIVVSVMSMVGLGISIDYGLLVVSRYRDAIREGRAQAAAVLEAARYGGRTVLVSGSAVAIGFGAMLLVPVSEIRSIGMGGLLVAGVAASIACTLLPVMLHWVSPWIDVGRIGRSRMRESGRRWRAWGSWVTRRPFTVLCVAGLPLVLLALQSVHLRIDLPRGRWLPETAESVRVLHGIDAVAKGNFGQIVQIIVQLPAGAGVRTESGWRGVSLLVRALARDARVKHVWAITTLNIKPFGGPELLASIPEAGRRFFMTDAGDVALVELLPRRGLTATESATLVRDIRALDLGALTKLDGVHMQVGGVAAFNVDYEDAIRHSLVPVGVSVIVATLLVLAIAFRSVLIPVKAVALNLLSVAAAFGAVATMFQTQWGAHLLGLPRALDGGFPIVPILVFCIVFGLSMDYEVFIVARIADGRRAGLSDRAALIEGMAGTGRVISFAAAIMIAIFGAFVFGDFILIKLLGFALGVAVLVDATVIRLALGPALIQLAGRWNWWPGGRGLPAKRDP